MEALTLLVLHLVLTPSSHCTSCFASFSDMSLARRRQQWHGRATRRCHNGAAARGVTADKRSPRRCSIRIVPESDAAAIICAAAVWCCNYKCCNRTLPTIRPLPQAAALQYGCGGGFISMNCNDCAAIGRRRNMTAQR
jgi:hypothetical protein